MRYILLRGNKKMEQITLEIISWNGYEEFVKLDVNDDQRMYVRDSKYTLEEAFLNHIEGICETEILAIYAEQKMIGYVALQYFKNESDSWYDLHRFMIDAGCQEKGFGKRAFAMILEHIRKCPMGAADRIKIEYMERNASASHIYHQHGFVDSDVYNQYGERTAWLAI